MVEFISDAIRTRRNLCVCEREGFKLKTSNYISLISISIILFLLKLSLGVCISQRIFHCWIYWHKVVHLLSSLISVESAVMSYFSFQILVICVSFFFFFLISLVSVLSILLIFSKNQLLVSFDFLYCFYTFYSPYFYINYFLLSAHFRLNFLFFFQFIREELKVIILKSFFSFLLILSLVL